MISKARLYNFNTGNLTGLYTLHIYILWRELYELRTTGTRNIYTENCIFRFVVPSGLDGTVEGDFEFGAIDGLIVDEDFVVEEVIGKDEEVVVGTKLDPLVRTRLGFWSE